MDSMDQFTLKINSKGPFVGRIFDGFMGKAG